MPYLLGLFDALAQQGALSSGRTWDDDADKNEAYDRGANMGELLFRALQPLLHALVWVLKQSRRARHYLP